MWLHPFFDFFINISIITVEMINPNNKIEIIIFTSWDKYFLKNNKYTVSKKIPVEENLINDCFIYWNEFNLQNYLFLFWIIKIIISRTYNRSIYSWPRIIKILSSCSSSHPYHRPFHPVRISRSILKIVFSISLLYGFFKNFTSFFVICIFIKIWMVFNITS